MRFLPIAGLLAAMASFQLGASFAERLFPMVGPAGAAALRLLGSSLILAVVRRPWRGLAGRPPAPALIAYGVSLGAMNTLFYLALARLPLGIAVAVEFVGPLGVAMAASRRLLDLAWIALAVGGLLLLLPLGLEAHSVDPIGVLLALAAGACWAAYIVFGRRAGNAHGGHATGLGVFIATLVFLPPQIALQGHALFPPAAIPIALGVALLSSALPYSLEMYALTRVPTRVFGTLMSLEPAVGALAGLTLLGQHLSLLQWTGISAVMAASLGAALAHGAAQEEPPQPV
ncbi:MAG TPA: EamA family transporter [Caulobacteraceae bacterium]|nr:EamA family transporter [Caulobacteraceae bacterium]